MVEIKHRCCHLLVHAFACTNKMMESELNGNIIVDGFKRGINTGVNTASGTGVTGCGVGLRNNDIIVLS